MSPADVKNMIGLAVSIAVNLLENIQLEQDNNFLDQDANLPIANMAAELKECPAYTDIVSYANGVDQRAKEMCNMNVFENSYAQFMGCQLPNMAMELNLNNIDLNSMDINNIFNSMDFDNIFNNMDFDNIFNNIDFFNNDNMDFDNIFNNMGFKNQEINNQFPVMNIIEPMLEDPCKMMKTTWLVS